MKRIINAHGDINIPAELREQLGWQEYDEIELSAALNRLVLTKTIPGCIFCHAALELVRIGDSYVCGDCIEKLHQAAKNDVALIT